MHTMNYETVSKIVGAATDSELPIVEEVLRRAGLQWEHVGCWTNPGDAERCEHCGESLSVLQAREETLPYADRELVTGEEG